jgi:hypothetical protein
MREYRASSRLAGDRAEELVYQFLKDKGIDIRRNADHEVDFTVWSPSGDYPLYHIEVEHKISTSEPHAIKDCMNFLFHKLDKYIEYGHKVYYVMVITHWKHFYVISMDEICRYGYRREPITDRKGMGKVYTVPIENIKKRSFHD